jgi:Ran GTPase-activating protein (RanGAP) involved in mRNA processing and transport
LKSIERHSYCKTHSILLAFDEYRSKKLEQTIAQSGATRSIVMLNCMQLYDQDIEIVVKQTLEKTQCMWLSLQYNEITSVGAAIIAKALNNNRTLYTLSLLANQVSDMGVKAFAEILAHNNCTLTILDLSENGITDAGCEHLAQTLKTNQTITLLYLSNNEISDRGVRLLCGTIKNYNQSLQRLCLSWNKLVTDESVDSLCDMIKYHQSSKILEVKDCNLSPIGEEKLQIAADLKKNFELFV